MPHIAQFVLMQSGPVAAVVAFAAFAGSFVATSPAFASTLGWPAGSRAIVLAHADVLPIAVVLGAGVLAWLLGHRRPRLEPARARKPEPRKGRRAGDR